jgi:hypothetical protein
MSSYYFIDRNGQQQGPVEANELTRYGVTPNTQVWKQGMSTWQVAGSIPELSGFFPPATTPPYAGYSSPQSTKYRMDILATDRGFWLALLLSIVTFGFYQWYLIYAFARETNIVCRQDGKHTRGLGAYILFSILTLGIYGIVWQVKLINRRCNFLAWHGKPEGLQVSTYLLTIFLFGWLTLGIMYIVVFCKNLYQQNAVNHVFNDNV